MIKIIQMQTIICDVCGKDYCEGTDYAAWDMDSPIGSMAEDDGWLIDDEKHCCPDCFYYDDNDEIIIKLTPPEEGGKDEQTN